MNNKTLANLLRQPYEKGKSWISYIKENNYNYNAITEFCNEEDFNLSFSEEHTCGDSYLCAKTWLNFSEGISGWFEFDSECDIDNSADEKEFIDKLQKLLEEVAFIHGKIQK